MAAHVNIHLPSGTTISVPWNYLLTQYHDKWIDMTFVVGPSRNVMIDRIFVLGSEPSKINQQVTNIEKPPPASDIPHFLLNYKYGQDITTSHLAFSYNPEGVVKRMFWYSPIRNTLEQQQRYEEHVYNQNLLRQQQYERQQQQYERQLQSGGGTLKASRQRKTMTAKTKPALKKKQFGKNKKC